VNRRKTLRHYGTASLVLAWAGGAIALEIPLDTDTGWSSLTYRNIPANAVAFGEAGLKISVDTSASPLVYRLDEPTKLTGIDVRARWRGKLVLPAGARQGEKGADDFVLKVGLVEAGGKTLNWFQRSIAAEWIRRLHDLAPESGGIDRIHFLSTTQQEELLGESRVHPLSELLHETRIAHLGSAGVFEMSHAFDEPVEVLGLWISADGDDTGSVFELVIESIELRVAEDVGD